MIYSASRAAKREELPNSIAKGRGGEGRLWGMGGPPNKRRESFAKASKKKLEITRTAERLWRINIKFLKLC